MMKHLRAHCYLTENVGDQQGRRRNWAPADNLFSRFFGFNTAAEFFSNPPSNISTEAMRYWSIRAGYSMLLSETPAKDIRS